MTYVRKADRVSVGIQMAQKFIEQLENGVVPWQKEWVGKFGGFFNAVSKKAYRGINPFILASTPYADPRWLTFKQCAAMGGSVKGEKGTGIIYAQIIKKPNKEDFFLRKIYTVFNAEQTTGIDWPDLSERTFEPIVEAQKTFDQYIMNGGPSIDFNGGDKAYYVPSMDAIHLPTPESFTSREAFYDTAFHEAGHSTGHESRLGRSLGEITPFGAPNYAFEELVAEITAAMVMNRLGIDRTFDNSVAYVGGWLKSLKNNMDMVVKAASKAQAATDVIFGTTEFTLDNA